MLSRKLKGRRIAVLAADGFEEVELAVPVAAMRAAGAQIDIVSLRHGRIRGVNLHEPASRVTVDRTVSDVSVDEYDALLIPGGFINPDLLRQSAEARDFVRKFDASGKPRWIRTERRWLTLSSLPRKDCGAVSHTNSTPSSSACFTSRCEPGMLALSRRYRHFTDLAPWRTAVRTQSIAVSPPPITTTLLPLAFKTSVSNAGTLSPSP